MDYAIATVNNQAITATVSIEALFNDFVRFVDASQKTIETYSKAIRQFLNYLKDHAITTPDRADILAYRDYLKQGHKPTTVQNYITAVKLFFKWTAQTKTYPDIADHVKGAKLDRNHKKDYLTSEQVKRVLTVAKGTGEQALRDYAILALMFTGGLRTIEVSRANIEDLRTVGNSTVLYIQGKGHTERTDYVKLAPEVETAIRDYLAVRANVSNPEPLFVSTSNNNAGERLTTKSVSTIVKTALKRAGFNSDRLTAHSTRHTAVTLALLGGMKLEEVQQFARHRNLSTTLIYAHNLDRAQNQCEATIAKAIF